MGPQLETAHCYMFDVIYLDGRSNQRNQSSEGPLKDLIKAKNVSRRSSDVFDDGEKPYQAAEK